MQSGVTTDSDDVNVIAACVRDVTSHFHRVRTVTAVCRAARQQWRGCLVEGYICDAETPPGDMATAAIVSGHLQDATLSNAGLKSRQCVSRRTEAAATQQFGQYRLDLASGHVPMKVLVCKI